MARKARENDRKRCKGETDKERNVNFRAAALCGREIERDERNVGDWWEKGWEDNQTWCLHEDHPLYCHNASKSPGPQQASATRSSSLRVRTNSNYFSPSLDAHFGTLIGYKAFFYLAPSLVPSMYLSLRTSSCYFSGLRTATQLSITR